MASLSRADTILQPIPVYAEAPVSIFSKEVSHNEDDNDDETIRIAEEPTGAIDTSIFDVFTEFDLDLSCLSRPASPEPSTSYLSHATPSPPVSPILSRSISFASAQSPSPAPTQSLGLKKSKKVSSPQLSATAPKSARGSWPLIKYAGRGTPIDRNRRLEWAGFASDSETAEDGVLFSAARSTSLDSNAIRPSQRSLSPEWHYSSNMSSSLSHSTHSEAATHKTGSIHEPPPALAPVEALGLNEADEWDSIMRTVLSPTREPEPPTPTGTNAADEDLKKEPSIHGTPGPDLARKEREPALPVMTPEQMEQMNNGLEIDLGIDAALDLGLGRGSGMNWFDLGLLPASASARESVSVYSSRAATPTRASPAASLRGTHQSTTSTKANRAGADAEAKSGAPRWWQKMLTRIRQVHNVITIHKNRF